MKHVLLVLIVGVLTSSLSARDRHWQSGVLRDPVGQVQAKPPDSFAIPIGGLWYLASNPPPAYIMVEGADGVTYVGVGRHAPVVIINDPIGYAIEGQSLYVRTEKPTAHEYKYRIVKQMRQP